ncbi:MAG: PEP/pyruvate-binding domain-containing protein [Deltaproteobacteria bacterium]
MTALGRISTGLAGLDRILDGLRMGDNVVWQVDHIQDYRHFVTPLLIQAAADERKVIYFRFGKHPPVIDSDPRVTVYELDPDTGFEAFSSRVYSIASEEGYGVYYIFDCLSELLQSWATDLMIGNFFKVVCPYLHELNTIAYFTVIRNSNSFETIARIRETTQLLIDVYQYEGTYYVHPIKVLGRYSSTMFLPHVENLNDFVPMTSSVQAAHFFSLFQQRGASHTERQLDYWDRIFLKAQGLFERLKEHDWDAISEEPEMCERLCQMLIGREERMLKLAMQYLTLEDLLEVRNRLIGSGYIGGKTVGMLLARSILRSDNDFNWEQWLEPHDSYYIGSDVYYTYLVENGCWNLRLLQKQPEYYFSIARELKVQILDGVIPRTIEEQFDQMLDYFGQAPIIVRSSSLLEDGFGNAFAGKYESVFCVNQGTPQERLERFEQAVKTVYASTLNDSALAYRLQRGLDQSDEQMALLVQRVSGSHHQHYFFPDLAGVAMSHNPYVWRSDMDSAAGMVRLVFGLGTRAVDRVGNDYPRLIALDKPMLRPDSSREDIMRFSQHNVDVLDTVLNEWGSVSLNKLALNHERHIAWDLTASYDYERTRRLRELGRPHPESWILTFEKLLSTTPYVDVMRRMLDDLQQAYDYPVDTEFTVNFAPDGTMQLNLLQCRPLQTFKHSARLTRLPEDKEGDRLFLTSPSFMGGNLSEQIKGIVYIGPEYLELNNTDKYQVARLVGKVNRMAKQAGVLPLMLIGPGRWGTTTPSLGVPVSFAEICNASILVEMAEQKEGFMPELSYGTHFFQDLVETQIFYIALLGESEGSFFDMSYLDTLPNSFNELFPGFPGMEKVIRVWNLEGCDEKIYIEADVRSREVRGYFNE